MYKPFLLIDDDKESLNDTNEIPNNRSIVNTIVCSTKTDISSLEHNSLKGLNVHFISKINYSILRNERNRFKKYKRLYPHLKKKD